jgi:Carboxypeptidase regulatory-like domain
MLSRTTLGLSLLAALVVAPGVYAQNHPVKKTGATISGIVLDANDKPVANAGVTCETSGGLKPRAVHTDAKGHFQITGLKGDSYDIRASANGAYSDWEKNIPLRTNASKEFTLRLLNGNTALSGTPTAQETQP